MNNIRNLWEETTAKYADLTAMRWLNKKDIYEKTYRELDEYVKRVRSLLTADGFKGAHIAIIGKSSPEWIEAFLGITTGVNTAVPLDMMLPDEELVELINRSDSEALFLDESRPELKEKVLCKCHKIKEIYDLTAEEFRSFPVPVKDDASAKPEDIGAIIYTSGTTGKSKGVMLTQKNLCDNVAAVEYDAVPGCVVLSVLPIHHAYCLVMDFLKTLSLGATICINDSFMHMVRNMSIFKPEVMLMVPLMIETIYKKISAAEQTLPEKSPAAKKALAEKVFGGKLRIIFTGGAHLDPYYIEKFEEYGVDVLEGYGMSECSPVISSNTPENHKAGSVGKPLKNVEISFDHGEILVRGSSVMQGYYEMPRETKEAVKDGWLHTGDKGYLDEDGYLFINGRVKNLIIMSNGENVSPEEIEGKLALSPLVAEVIITGENNGLTAEIFPDQDAVAGMNPFEIKEAISGVIDNFNAGQPSYRHVTALRVRETPFVRNTTGKINRYLVSANERKDAV